MQQKKYYTEHSGKAVEAGNKFSHVMAIALDPRSQYKKGIIRCIMSREGDVEIAGYIDRSLIYMIYGDSLEHFEIGERIMMKNEGKIIDDLCGDDFYFIGFEDPDIFTDEKTGMMHIYFTMPFLSKDQKHDHLIYLGHAVGKDLNSLEMTMPVLAPDEMGRGAKELSIAPLNKKGIRLNLVESNEKEVSGLDDVHYSTVRIAKAKDMNADWEFGDVVFHPAEHNFPWIAGHASPGPFLPKTFIDVGEGKLLGLMNGREANQTMDDRTKYGMFSVGLFIYDYEKGVIDWVSTEPVIIDSEAKTITFASQFVSTKNGEGILYAHVDDSFVRAYTLKAELLKELIPNFN